MTTLDTDSCDADTERFPRRVAWWVVQIPVVLVLLGASPLGRNGFFIIMGLRGLLLIWTGLAFWSFVRCVGFVIRRRWRLSALAAVLPLVVCLADLNFWSFINGCYYVGDVLHFIVARPYYEHVIARLPRDGRPRLAVFRWSDAMSHAPDLVYDESDEITLAPGRQPARWRTDSELVEITCDGDFRVQSLWCHYYLVSSPC